MKRKWRQFFFWQIIRIIICVSIFSKFNDHIQSVSTRTKHWNRLFLCRCLKSYWCVCVCVCVCVLWMLKVTVRERISTHQTGYDSRYQPNWGTGSVSSSRNKAGVKSQKDPDMCSSIRLEIHKSRQVNVDTVCCSHVGNSRKVATRTERN